MRVYRTDAIVLRDVGFGETDRLITLFSREMGKLRGVAKGSRRPKSRLLGGTQPFVYSRLMMYRGRNLDIITQCEVLKSFNRLREDLLKVGCASCMSETVDLMTREGEPVPALFDVLREGLERLDEGHSSLESLAALCSFELKALKAAGYFPKLDGCVLCRPIGSAAGAAVGGARDSFVFPSSNEREDSWLDVEEGGLVCRGCMNRDHKLLRVSGQTLDLMRSLASPDAVRFKIVLSGADTLGEIQGILEEYIEYRLERPVKSYEFLRRIWKGWVECKSSKRST